MTRDNDESCFPESEKVRGGAIFTRDLSDSMHRNRSPL